MSDGFGSFSGGVVVGPHQATHSEGNTDPILGPLGLTNFMSLKEIATPGNPVTDKVKLFARLNGANIELILRSSTGAEVVLATLPN